ncbi:tRNA epoxyqueuosine(34) reductase QueG [bacterium]|nr:tRNA epoxyqueuosine(34) reductase QueG [bacterium]
MTDASLQSLIEERVRQLGFDWFGIARAEALESELAELREFLDEDRHGSMEWLARDPERRADPERVLPECRSVIVLGINYQQPDDIERRDAPPVGKISRYARGRDYHRVFEKRLKKLCRFIDHHGPAGTQSRAYVDYGPVMERQWAQRAGLGFIGKHTLLINPEQGSYFFLAVVLSTVELEPTPPLESSCGCGDCRLCIDACPTGAIEAPWRFDARRCLSYLTIEHSGPIDEELWSHFAGWVFGCDICQDVCPYNRKRARVAAEDAFAPRKAPAGWSLVEMLQLDEDKLDDAMWGNPLRRAGHESLIRNAAIVASERGGEAEARELQRIAEDASQPDWLRETARQAFERLLDSPRDAC